MKKNKKSGIIYLLLMIFSVIIPTLIPKSKARIIKINKEEITTFSEEMIGEVYSYGTPINLDIDVELEYQDKQGNMVDSYLNHYNSSQSNEFYVGTSSLSTGLREISNYWKITNVYRYSANIHVTFQAIDFNEECRLDELEVGSVCYHDDEIIAEEDYLVVYRTQEDQNIQFEEISPTSYSTGYTYSYNPITQRFYIGRPNNESLENIATVWKVKDIEESSGGWTQIVFTPTTNKEVEFKLNCDKESIQYQEKTACHFSAKNFKITEDPIVVEFESKETLEITEIVQNDFFTVENNDNNITATANYLSTSKEDVEIFSFEVKATKDTGEENNVTLKNIKYYNNVEYRELATTININNNNNNNSNNNIINNNPLTKSQKTILKIVLIEILLLGGTTLLLKKKKSV